MYVAHNLRGSLDVVWSRLLQVGDLYRIHATLKAGNHDVTDGGARGKILEERGRVDCGGRNYQTKRRPFVSNPVSRVRGMSLPISERTS